MSGGTGEDDNTITNVEVIVPKTGQFCSLPSLPDEKRYYHTMDGLYICGDKVDNCLHFSNGEWSHHLPLEQNREGHSSWQMDKGILLMGGFDGYSSEIVSTIGEQGGSSFSMKYRTR